MESLIPLIINLLSGAFGGNLAGSLMKKFSLGTLGNSIVGVLGGGIGGSLLGNAFGMASGGMDIAGIPGSVASGGVGGGILMVIVGLIKSMISK